MEKVLKFCTTHKVAILCAVLLFSFVMAIKSSGDAAKKRNAEARANYNQSRELCIQAGGVPIKSQWARYSLARCEFPPQQATH